MKRFSPDSLPNSYFCVPLCSEMYLSYEEKYNFTPHKEFKII